MKALVLENNSVNSGELVNILAQHNLSLKVTHSPLLFLDAIKKNDFDIIFIDVVVFLLNGYNFKEIISQNVSLQNTPVIFLGSTHEINNVIKGIDLFCYDFIKRPYCAEEIETKVKNIMKLKQLQDEKDNFIETLKHDLKTPARSEIRAMELLWGGHFGELNPFQMEVLEEILNSGKCMFFMLDSLLSKYNFDKNKMKLYPTEFSIKKLQIIPDNFTHRIRDY